MRQSSWQSRLTAKNNKIAQKLVDNSIILTGYSTDVVVIDEITNAVNDPTAFNINAVGIINIIFPEMKDIPLRRFLNSSGGSDYVQASNAKDDHEPFVCYSPIETILNQGSIMLKFFENPSGVEPLILPLQIAEVKGDFGGRSMVLQKFNVTYCSTPFHPKVLEYLLQLAERRGLLKW